MTLLLLAGLSAIAGVHHDLDVSLSPADHTLQVTDALRWDADLSPDEDGGYRFLLHAGLEPKVRTGGWRLERVEGDVPADFFGINATSAGVPDAVPVEAWRLVPRGRKQHQPVTLQYGGVIHHPVAQAGKEYQRSFEQTAGTIQDEGVFLSGTSRWVPSFGDGLVDFELTVDGLDAGWSAVSQGERTSVTPVHWSSPNPVDEVYLVAGPWHETDLTVRGAAGPVHVMALLHDDDPALAWRYLQATRRYLTMYEGILPPYPYRSFALVENFWETGYGMPGFTLLGPQIIRFPWILTSSYPHELLHNWWGNSVYVDAETGNWCEGLTAYMADHMFAEQRGEGARYRRDTLEKYTDFVGKDKDFPLSEFGGRDSAASEAVGYGKALMLFHSARRALSDAAFLEAMGRFYTEEQFERASYADLARALTEVSGQDWGPYFETWTTRTGAPRLTLGDVQVSGEGPWTVDVEVKQVQDEDPYPVTVPVVVTVEGADAPVMADMALGQRAGHVQIQTDGRPLRVDIDPAFDVMRRLEPMEVPPAISRLMGAEAPTFVLPSAAAEDERAAWTELAKKWAAPGEPALVQDDAIDALPDGDAWVLGWDNRFAGAVAERLADATLDASGVTMGDHAVSREGASAVLVARGAADPERAVGWVGSDGVAAIPGLARKLPHYTRYSYLSFEGDAPDNNWKGTWDPTGSPLTRALAAGPMPALKLPERTPLATLPPRFDAHALGELASWLADPAREGRGLGSAGLEAATARIDDEFSRAGLKPWRNDGFRDVFTGKGPDGPLELTNLVARIPGTQPDLPPVLLMAHIDHLGTGWPDVHKGDEGKVHPGADDNASGVAVVTEVAAALAADPARKRDIIVGITTGEESGLQGARHLVAELGDHKPAACLVVDTVGRVEDDKIIVLDAGTAREWRYLFMGVGYTTGAPIAFSTEPLDSSDQGACIAAGIPAVQLFAGPHADYHRPTDTADKLDADGMATAADVTHEAAAYLAERVEPLTSQIEGGAPVHPAAAGGTRKVSLGTMPDFAFPGPGVRVSEVMPDSAAAAAGVRAGDIVVGLDDVEIKDLRGYSNALKAHQPGDEVVVHLRRGDEEVSLKATLTER